MATRQDAGGMRGLLMPKAQPHNDEAVGSRIGSSEGSGVASCYSKKNIMYLDFQLDEIN